MTQALLSVQAVLIAIQTGVVGLNIVDDNLEALIVFACGVALAGVGPFLPKVSSAIRAGMGLRWPFFENRYEETDSIVVIVAILAYNLLFVSFVILLLEAIGYFIYRIATS